MRDFNLKKIIVPPYKMKIRKNKKTSAKRHDPQQSPRQFTLACLAALVATALL
jgi:hypothetical protein